MVITLCLHPLDSTDRGPVGSTMTVVMLQSVKAGEATYGVTLEARVSSDLLGASRIISQGSPQKSASTPLHYLSAQAPPCDVRGRTSDRRPVTQCRARWAIRRPCERKSPL